MLAVRALRQSINLLQLRSILRRDFRKNPIPYRTPAILDFSWRVATNVRCDARTMDLKAKIVDVFECAAKEVIELVEADRENEKNSAEPLPEWMTAAQLARYWQHINASGEPITLG